MRKLDRRRLASLLDEFSRIRLLVIGDVVLDEYVWGDVDRVSPEAPVPVVRFQRESFALGGAGNVAHNVVALGGHVSFCSIVGDDDAGRRAQGLLEGMGANSKGLVIVKGRPTTRKTRIIARSQQVVRFDRETLDAPPASAARELKDAIGQVLSKVDGVVIEDYGKGVLSQRFVTAEMRRFREAGLPVVVDPKVSVAPYRGAELIKPNLREVESLSGVKIRSEATKER